MGQELTTDEQLEKRLSREQFKVLREKGTEAPFSGKYLNFDETGVYKCAVCGAKLFESNAKYESDIESLAGWPSFSDVINKGAVKLKDDNSQGMSRVEVVCSHCGSHLGHLFDDESSPTGQHYCINSLSLDFKKSLKKETKG